MSSVKPQVVEPGTTPPGEAEIPAVSPSPITVAPSPATVGTSPPPGTAPPAGTQETATSPPGTAPPDGTQGTVVTPASPSPTKTPPVPTPRPTISPKPTRKPVPLPTWPPAEKCNICGEGNVIGSELTRFKFEALGTERTLGCKQLQDILDGGNSPPGFCEAVGNQALEPCQCQRPNGQLVALPSNADDGPRCNICEGENFIGEVGAVVNLIDHEGLTRKFPCSELQRLANAPNIFPGTYVKDILAQPLTLRPFSCWFRVEARPIRPHNISYFLFNFPFASPR